MVDNDKKSDYLTFLCGLFLILDIKFSPQWFVRDGEIDPEVEVDKDQPGQHHCNQELDVLLIDLIVEHVVGEFPVNPQVGRYLEKFWEIKRDAEQEDR